MTGRSFVVLVAAPWGRDYAGARVAAELGKGQHGRGRREERKRACWLNRGRFDGILGMLGMSGLTWWTRPGLPISAPSKGWICGAPVSPDV